MENAVDLEAVCLGGKEDSFSDFLGLPHGFWSIHFL